MNKIEKIRNAIADYMQSEGCECCRDSEAHDEAENRLGELLNIEKFPDDSGFDWRPYRTSEK